MFFFLFHLQATLSGAVVLTNVKQANVGTGNKRHFPSPPQKGKDVKFENEEIGLLAVYWSSGLHISPIVSVSFSKAK